MKIETTSSPFSDHKIEGNRLYAQGKWISIKQSDDQTTVKSLQAMIKPTSLSKSKKR